MKYSFVKAKGLILKLITKEYKSYDYLEREDVAVLSTCNMCFHITKTFMGTPIAYHLAYHFTRHSVW